MEHYITIEKHPDYEVSNLGNVRNKKTGTIRKQTDRNGYRKVRLNNKDESIHRLVADTFFDGDHSDLQVNYIDGNKSNNFLGNLEWVTPSENVSHAFRTGLKKPTGGPPRIQVIDVSTGKIYDSLIECAKDIGGTGPGVAYSIEHQTIYKGHKLRKY